MGPFRLFTTLVDPEEVSATELAAGYAQRWEIESVFGELKTHQRGSKMVLGSKSLALVLQEVWGDLCCLAVLSPGRGADHGPPQRRRARQDPRP